jgi:hypothetical protein
VAPNWRAPPSASCASSVTRCGRQPTQCAQPLPDHLSGPWTLQFAPNPGYLPGGAQAADPNAPYKNIINDFAADPKNPNRVIIAAGWRSGDTYNGFYTRTGGIWQRTTLTGDIASDAANVGTVTFAAAADGSRYYAIEQSPTQLATNPPAGSCTRDGAGPATTRASPAASRSGVPTGPDGIN